MGTIEQQQEALQNWATKLGFTVKLYYDADKRKAQKFIARHDKHIHICSLPLNYENLNTWFHGVDTAEKINLHK